MSYKVSCIAKRFSVDGDTMSLLGISAIEVEVAEGVPAAEMLRHNKTVVHQGRTSQSRHNGHYAHSTKPRLSSDAAALPFAMPAIGSQIYANDIDRLAEAVGYRASSYWGRKLVEMGIVRLIEDRKGLPRGNLYEVIAHAPVRLPTGKKVGMDQLTLAPSGTRMRHSEIAALLPSIGWRPKSVDYAIRLLQAAGRIQKVGSGSYEVLQTRG